MEPESGEFLNLGGLAHTILKSKLLFLQILYHYNNNTRCISTKTITQNLYQFTV